ncbi:hypothetical protein AB0K15_21060 [Amycolatopsis sp. NPDC049253]|uniref:hypothetical protein n=1 Tax=Amycolatopsis sp. NPDC049253 TaxID=3155274 RepID=UPI00344AC960
MHNESVEDNPIGAVSLPQPSRVGSRNHALAGDKPRAADAFDDWSPTVVSFVIGV